ncbi:MAG: hypothetical protein SGBAC_005244 [Bacillariaceae sp.]
MSRILATDYNPRRQEVAIAVGGVTAASFILYQAYVGLSKNEKDKNQLPRSSFGILETVRVLAGPRVPFHFLEMAKELDSHIFELNLPLPGHPKVVVVSEPEDARDILKDNLSEKPDAFYGRLVEISPTGDKSLFAMKADAEWHRRRKGTAPAFSQKHVRRMNEVAVKQTEKWLKEYLAPLVEKQESFDIASQMLNVILKAFCETALEYVISDEEIEMFVSEWDLIAIEYILKSASNPFRKYLTAILPERRRAKQACDAVQELFYRIIDNYKALESPIEGTVIDLLMKNPTFNSRHEIASEIFAYMVAGHDTTAITVSWILMELGKHPEEQRSLRETLSKVKPEDWSKSDHLKNVVREGMRLHPVAGAVSRAIGRDMITKKGNYFLPKGTFAFLPFYSIFHHEEAFEDADTFMPSRWENPTELMKVAFLPFAAGKQNCIGQSLAKVEVDCVLARMIQEYDFSVEEEGHGEFHLVLKPVGLRMKATNAKVAYVRLSKDEEDKKLPRSSMGTLETIRMMNDPDVPFNLLQMAKDLNSFIFQLNLPIPGHSKVVVVADAEDARDILTDSLSEKPDAIYGQLVQISPTGDKSLFTMKADAEWHGRRKGTAPALSQKHVRRMNEVAVKHTEKWLKEYLAPLVEKNQSFDAANQMMKVVLKAFCETALEYIISDEEVESFIEKWHLIATEYLLKSSSNPFRKFLSAILPARRRAKEARDSVYALFYRVIKNYRALDSPIEGTVINLLMKNPTFKNDHELAAELFVYVIAGHDTTAITLTWTLMELGKHPEEQRSLRETLSKVKPEEWVKSDLLKNVCREGMRLHPVSAIALSRTIGRDMITKKGSYFLPKGTFAFLPFYLIFRNDEVFEDADTFMPSRWENPTELMKVAHMPFAAGKQNCVGQSLGKVEVHCILARMIQEYDFSVEEEGHGEFNLVLKPIGLRMKATRV